MSECIIPEPAVEAAAKALAVSHWGDPDVWNEDGDLTESAREFWRSQACTVLRDATPLIEAEILRRASYGFDARSEQFCQWAERMPELGYTIDEITRTAAYGVEARATAYRLRTIADSIKAEQDAAETEKTA